MRLISEDGRLDVPYENVSLEMIKKDDPDGLNTYEVWAIENGGGTSRWLMACYFSEEMALGAMQQARFASQRSAHWFEFRTRGIWRDPDGR